MARRRGAVAGVALALSLAAACSGGPASRPVAGAGQVRKVVDNEYASGESFHGFSGLAVGGDGTLYVINSLLGPLYGDQEITNLVAIPPRGPARLVAGLIHSVGFRPVQPADVLDPFPQLGKTGLALDGLAVGPDGTIYVGEENNHVVWAIGPGRRVRRVAGNGQKGFSGDGGPATAAMLSDPHSLVVNPKTGDLYISEYRDRVRKVDPAGIITTVAGGGKGGPDGDGGPAVQAHVGTLEAMGVDARNGDLYLCDGPNIRKIDAGGTITRVAGTGERAKQPSPNGRPPTEVPVDCDGLVVDPRDGTVYFSDGNEIRRVDRRSGLLEAVAGNGREGNSNGPKPALKASISPGLTAIDARGNIYFADNHQIDMLGASPLRP